MNIEDEFNMPVKISKHESKPSWYILDEKDFMVCSILDESEAKVVAMAINNHCNLVRALKDVIENNGDIASIINAKNAISELTSDDIKE